MKFSRANTILLVAIILINGLTIGLPFVPAILFKVEAANGKKRLALQAKIDDAPKTSSQPNRLTIPAMLFDESVYEGPDTRTLRQGVWHRPHSSTPGTGNTVLVAHRFTYDNPRGAFYNLDKVRPGDSIGLVWENTPRQYIVRQVKVVKAHDTYIEDPTAHDQLTLYTCTPLALPKDRLVVIATPKEKS